MSVNQQGLPDVVVVSAFGRGNWLAAELAEKNFSVQLLDVTESLGRWAPEDWEGPFGCLQDEKWTSSQQSRLTEEDYHDQVSDGFTVWSKEGPLDTRGHLINYWLESQPMVAAAKKYLAAYQAGKNDEIEDLKDDLLVAGFKQNWLAQLAHQLASPLYVANALALTEGVPLPLWAPLSVRRNSRKGLQKSLEWARAKGCEVLAPVKLEDVAIEGRQIAGVQISGATSRVVRAMNVVWGLSSLETQFVAPSIATQFFPKGALQPQWCWMRWRVSGKLGHYGQVVPRHFVMIEDLGLPWTHSNLLIVQRCAVEGAFDVWARIPAHHRFQRAYCEEFGQQIVEKMNQRLPQFSAQVQDLPQDYHYNFDELGPALLPVFEPEARKEWSARQFKNLEYDGAEWVLNLDWTGRFERQNELLQKLMKWKTQELARQAKGGGVDREIHPS
ncbi:MAG: hypothetical protein AB7N80_07940 [Bdellovibrionales bacterium]